jgi:hypothetical protein
MRLINVTSPERLYFEEFNEPKVPKYAILSHTWGQEETTYTAFCRELSPMSEWVNIPSYGYAYSFYGSRPKQKSSGFEKIFQLANKARKQNLDYIWIDTCKYFLRV